MHESLIPVRKHEIRIRKGQHLSELERDLSWINLPKQKWLKTSMQEHADAKKPNKENKELK
jgi:hypothetical protein